MGAIQLTNADPSVSVPTDTNSGDDEYLRRAPDDDKGYLLVPLQKGGACEIDWSSLERLMEGPLLVRTPLP
jgi:hypothetical protein